MGLLDDTRNFMQGASNSVTGMVSAPVDGISWALRKAGLGNVIGDAPVGGSDWMQAQGLLRAAPGKAGLLGEALGGVLPMVAAAKAPQIAAGMLKAGQNLAAPAAMNPQMGAVVYHGSPHTFDSFDMSKIGTGEGAQAYGHGLYFADAPEVANEYKTALAGAKLADGTIVKPDWTDPRYLGLNELRKAGGDVPAARAAVLNGSKDWPEQVTAFDDLVKRGVHFDNGNFYKVDLPDEHIAKMLDWDKPLSQSGDAAIALGKDAFAHEPRFNPDYTRGMELMQQMGTGPDAMQKLRQAGIPGIRYLDQGSRTGGAGTSNYVVFDDALPKILERNGTSLGF